MKKLRMIVTSVVVLTIIGSAVAFKAKCCTFCVKEGTVSGNCTTILQNVKTTTDEAAPLYKFYPAWDGTQSRCTQDAGGNCTVQVRLTTGI